MRRYTGYLRYIRRHQVCEDQQYTRQEEEVRADRMCALKNKLNGTCGGGGLVYAKQSDE